MCTKRLTVFCEKHYFPMLGHGAWLQSERRRPSLGMLDLRGRRMPLPTTRNWIVTKIRAPGRRHTTTSTSPVVGVGGTGQRDLSGTGADGTPPTRDKPPPARRRAGVNSTI